ncbi:MAG TPA: LacI family DNA-binding transcriptional regulator [Candidatus Dormibacteraeota bacterium]|nr:LacI family DNA-binding transcriptional regulator [Candidatus Dormibacteraeota bacterium]
MRRPPTILDVASQAGVSKSTVSNVVRGLPGVSSATRERVRAAIDELGYRPNVLARQLVQQRTSIIGVVVGDLGNPFFAEMAKSVERYAVARGYTAMFCNTEGESQSEAAGVETLLEYRVAGIVFLAFSGDSRTIQETLELEVPVVFVSCSATWGDVVTVDDNLGAQLGTNHLIALGHKKIAYISIPELEDQSAAARYEGYVEALLAAGLGPPTRISWLPPSDQADLGAAGKCRLADLFSGSERSTAVLASNDVAAISLQEFADRVHLRVPQDLSIVGFDDVPMAGLARIALTTIAQPRDELAKLGIDTIADRIERKLKGPPRTTLVDVKLVARKSTAAPPGR